MFLESAAEIGKPQHSLANTFFSFANTGATMSLLVALILLMEEIKTFYSQNIKV